MRFCNLSKLRVQWDIIIIEFNGQLTLQAMIDIYVFLFINLQIADTNLWTNNRPDKEMIYIIIYFLIYQFATSNTKLIILLNMNYNNNIVQAVIYLM